MRAENAQLKATLATLTAAQFSQKVCCTAEVRAVDSCKPVKSGQPPPCEPRPVPAAGARPEKEPGLFVMEKEGASNKLQPCEPRPEPAAGAVKNLVPAFTSEWKVSMSRKTRRRSKKQPPDEEPAPLSRLD